VAVTAGVGTRADQATRAFHDAATRGDWAAVDARWGSGIVPMVREDAALLLRTLEALPAEVAAARPSMVVVRETLPVWASDSDADGYRATMRAYAESCVRVGGPEWESLPLGELLVVATGCLVHLRLGGRLLDSAAVGARVDAALATQAPPGRALDGRTAWFHLQRAVTSTLLLDDAIAIRAYQQTWERGTGAGVDVVRSHAAGNLALTFALDGDEPRALRWCERSRSIDVRGWPGRRAADAGVHLAAGLLALDHLDDAAARRALDRLSDGAEPVELWPFAAFLTAREALGAGRATEGLIELERSLRVHDADRGGGSAAAVLSQRATADLLLACGRGDQAAAVIGRGPGGGAWMRVPAARLRILGPEGAGPDGTAGAGSDAWAADTPGSDRVELLLLGAVEALGRGAHSGAARLMDQALDRYERSGLLRPFATLAPGDLGELLALTGRRLARHDAARLASRPPVYPARLVWIGLSRSEQAVLEALSGTRSRQAMATSLFVSVNTVKSQLASVYRKLGCTNRSDALRLASRHGLLPGPGPLLDGPTPGPLPDRPTPGAPGSAPAGRR